ncbi:MAG: RcnB family protein [Pseudomonadota bacterium]|nr:RcnB family protein [Pseudomonadota bacterium]
MPRPPCITTGKRCHILSPDRSGNATYLNALDAFAQRNDHGNDRNDQRQHDNGSRNNNNDHGNDQHRGRNDRHDSTPAANNGLHNGQRGAEPGHDMRGRSRFANEYRGNLYVVNDWRGHHLSAPARGQHWVQTGGDYVLVAIATGIIAQVLLNN